MTQRWKLTLEYDGGPFAGWQRQAGARSVQEALEDAIRRMTGDEVRVTCAGRTDAGVHATGQVVHVDLAYPTTGWKLRDALNALVRPEPIAIQAAEPVDDRFNARFSAIGRRYRYRILDRRAPPALDRGRVWHVPFPLDETAMAEGAAHLLGWHDFTSFRAGECQATSPWRTLDRLDVRRVGAEIHLEAAARSFLHHQVRNVVGTLWQVGSGRRPPEDMARVLAARDRAAAGATAPPHGLYLEAVLYPLDGVPGDVPEGAPEAADPEGDG